MVAFYIDDASTTLLLLLFFWLTFIDFVIEKNGNVLFGVIEPQERKTFKIREYRKIKANSTLKQA